MILIEYDHQQPIAMRDPPYDRNVPTRNHVHVVVRTPNGNDYGKDLLREHYLAEPGDARGVENEHGIRACNQLRKARDTKIHEETSARAAVSFLLIRGGLLFLIAGLRIGTPVQLGSGLAQTTKIVITPGDVESIITSFTNLWRRSPRRLEN